MKLSHFVCADNLTEREYTATRTLILFSGILAVLLGAASAVLAYDNWGASATASGRGGASIAFAGDPACIFYNPAGLVGINQYMLYGMYDRQSRFGYPLEEKPYALVTAGALPFAQGVLALGFAQRGSWFNEMQIVTHNALALSFARYFSSSVAIGANVKYLFNTNYGNTSGADIDLGAMFLVSTRLTFGLAAENLLGTKVEPDDLGTYFFYNRRQLKLGLAYEVMRGEYATRLGFDTIFKEKKDLSGQGNNLNNFGIEQSLPLSSSSTVSLRVGYSLGKDYNQDFNSYAFGFSYELRRGSTLYRLDYSFQDYPFESSESIAGDNRIAVTLAWGTPQNIQSFAKDRKYLSPAVVDIQENKKKNDKSISGSVSQTKAATEESISVTKTTQTSQDSDTIAGALTQLEPQTDGEATRRASSGTFAGLEVVSQVKSSQDETAEGKFYVLLFQYNWEEKLKSVAKWKILISSSASDSFLTHGSDPSILQIISGQGMPPTAVGWEGDDKNGKKVVPGNYFYALYLKSIQGERFLSAWSPIMVE